MSTLLKSIVRWIPWTGMYGPPQAYKFEVRLIDHGSCVLVHTPFAALDGRADMTDTDLERFARDAFVDEAAALAEAQRRYPHWENKNNQAIAGRLVDSIRWHGDFMGPCQVADAVGVTREELYELARGKRKATRAQAKAALDYHGVRV